MFFEKLCYNLWSMDIKKYEETINGIYHEKFSEFKNLLLEYNQRYNLTSVLDEKGILYKHFLDSVAGESFFPSKARVVEIGSGGGFPSVPLKIVRDDLDFTLIESTGKKCAYLKDVVDKLGLNCVKVLNMRAEDGAKSPALREKFDVVCARAVAKLNTLCEYCLPFLKIGGVFVAYKGELNGELEEALNSVRILGGRVKNVANYELPEEMGKRSLVIIEKIGSTPSKYPRGNGKERKNPL